MARGSGSAKGRKADDRSWEGLGVRERPGMEVGGGGPWLESLLLISGVGL